MDDPQFSLAGLAKAKLWAHQWVIKHRRDESGSSLCDETEDGASGGSSNAGLHELLQPSEPLSFPNNTELRAFAFAFLERYEHQITSSKFLDNNQGDSGAKFIRFLDYVLTADGAWEETILPQYESFRATATKAYRDAIDYDWEEYTRSVRQEPGLMRERGRFYVGQTLLVTYLFSQQDIQLFENWKDTRRLIVGTTGELLEKRNSGRWQRMKRIRNRFIDCWGIVNGQLTKANDPAFKELCDTLFVNPQVTWNLAIRAMTEDIQFPRLPRTLNGFLALLVQSWAVASCEESSRIKSTESFFGDLNGWSFAARNNGMDYSPMVDRFIRQVWPEWIDHDTPLRNDGPTSLPNMELLMENILSDDTQPDFALARRLVAYLMDTDEDLYRGPNISLEAATVCVTLEVSWEDDQTALGKHDPRFEDPIGSPLDVPDKQLRHTATVQYLLRGFILSTIVEFMNESKYFGLPKGLLPRVIPFDDAAIFVDAGEKILRKIHPGLSEEKLKPPEIVRNMLHDVKLGILRTASDLLLQMRWYRTLRKHVAKQILDIFFVLCHAARVRGITRLGGELLLTRRSSLKRTRESRSEDRNMKPTEAKRCKVEESTKQLPRPMQLIPPCDSPVEMTKNDEHESDNKANSGQPSSSLVSTHSATNEDKLKCKICGKRFSTATNRQRHETTSHTQKIACKYCGKEGGTRSDYKAKHLSACKMKTSNV